MRIFLVAATLTAFVGKSATSLAQTPQDLADRAEAVFAQGKLEDAIKTYDQLAELVPSVAPLMWQRGVALYELGRYDDCAAQFASYHDANPGDLENAAWHFFCVAREGAGLEKARTSVLQAGPDRRVLREQIYDMIRGRMTPQALTALADTSVGVVQFYGHFYGALYFEALGDRTTALREMRIAAGDGYKESAGFLHLVAVLDRDRLERKGGLQVRPGTPIAFDTEGHLMFQRDWLAVTSEQALRFFFERLQDVSDTDRAPQGELLYNASMLAHFATTSTTSAETFPPSPSSLRAIFDVFVLDQSGQADPEIMEAAGSQCLLLTGFFCDQLAERHNVGWYAKLGAGFYEQASRLGSDEARRRMMHAMSAHFEFWRQQQSRLARELRDAPRLIPRLH